MTIGKGMPEITGFMSSGRVVLDGLSGALRTQHAEDAAAKIGGIHNWRYYITLLYNPPIFQFQCRKCGEYGRTKENREESLPMFGCGVAKEAE